MSSPIPVREADVQRRSKYRAIRTEVDGIVFHSRKEANRYCELKLLEKAGEIEQLTLQPRYALTLPGASNEIEKLGTYSADFKYWDRKLKSWHVEDVKGFRTPLYKWKKKHVEAQYGITITEI